MRMTNSTEEYELTKKCSKKDFVNLKTNFYFKNDIEKHRNQRKQCRGFKQKRWKINICEKLRSYIGV